MAPRSICAAVAALAFATHLAGAWVLPGTAPVQYADGDRVPFFLNKLTSAKTHLGRDPYSLRFCSPDVKRQEAENLGEHLTGETIKTSPYGVFMKRNETCMQLCAPIALTTQDVDAFVTAIDQGYSQNWLLDNLPAAAAYDEEDTDVEYSRGIPIGAKVEGDAGGYILFNHAKMLIKYHEDANYVGARVVGFDVVFLSVDQHEGVSASCVKDALTGMPAYGVNEFYLRSASITEPPSVTFSYDVLWVPSEVQWASRWDVYLSMGGMYSNSVHWFAIINSVIITFFLTGMVAMIMLRTLRADIMRYNRVPTDEEKAEEREESGWKLVHGDVFRPPTHLPTTFAVLAGIGAQLLVMAGITIVCAAIGFVSPANRGSLMIALVMLFMLLGVLSGYVTARLHKFMNGTYWHRLTLVTALAFPAIIFSVLFIINLFVWSTGSVNAVKFTSMLTVVALWLLVSVPLVYLGAYYGFKADKLEVPVRVSTMPRQVPTQHWYLRLPVVMLIGGFLPFGAVYIELLFILSSLWLDQYYYVFGFLLFIYIFTLITCAEISITLTYFQLCAEDYRWWWRSMLVPGASGTYMFIYFIMFYNSTLDLTGAVSKLMYFGYMGLVALMFTLITAAAGFFSTFWFVRKIYGAIKVD